MGRSHRLNESQDNGVSPVIAIILMVAVTVLLSAAIGIIVFDLAERGASDGNAQSVAAQIDETSDGMQIMIISTESAVDVQKNGTTVYTFDETDVGTTVRLTGLSKGDKITLITNSSNPTVVTTKTASTNIAQVGDGTTVLSGGTQSYTLTWSSASDWDASTTSGLEHSSLLGARSVRLGGPEDDGIVSDYTVNKPPPTHEAITTDTAVGPYARHIKSNASTQEYHTIYTEYPTTATPDQTTVYLKLPYPNNNNWLFKFGAINESGSGFASIAFDSAAHTNEIAILKTDVGWKGGGDYPANSWFNLTIDWDWSNQQYSVYVDGQYRNTTGFRSPATGISKLSENWDWDEGYIDGYIDHVMPLYAGSGNITTASKTTSGSLDPTTLTVTNLTYETNGGSMTLYVESDPDGDGVFDETSDPISLDGNTSYNVTGLTSVSDSFRFYTEFMPSSDASKSPEFHSGTLSGSTP